MADSIDSPHTNTLGQPIGFPVPDWKPAKVPGAGPLIGDYCRLEKVNLDVHGEDLFHAFLLDEDARNWTYLPYGPFETMEQFRKWVQQTCLSSDPYFYSVVDRQSGRAVGIASYLRINPADGVVEVGHIHFSPLCQRTRIASEAMYLMMKQVFEECGYRRYEWKCDALNAPSRRAAERLGFSFEGVFRQLTMYKNRNRDTAWFAMVDAEWPRIRNGFSQWLSSDNFDSEGRQKRSLEACRTC
ncbi:MAG: GNAT family protein [Pseudomonadota bacterium]